MDLPQSGKESIIGLNLNDIGKPVKTTVHRDGSVESSEIELESSDCYFLENPSQTFEPETYSPSTVGALQRKEIHGLTSKQHVERSLMLEAIALKVTSSSTGRELTNDAKIAAFDEFLKILNIR